MNLSIAFQNCLDSYCQERKESLVLVPELTMQSGLRPDGTVKDSLRMARGYWEAKDSDDDLDSEIQKKFDKGYPRDNIVFEDTEIAVLVQNGDVEMRVDMRRPDKLHGLIRRFLDYELPQIEEFRKARQQFTDDLPTVLENLRGTILEAEANNADYQAAAADFLKLCHQTIGPDVSDDDVREMLLQHILTKDIFLRIFSDTQFHNENSVAKQLDSLEQTFFTGSVKHNAIDRLRAYYGAIGRAAFEIADYSEKQKFIKAIYEDFYKVYNPKAADRLGVVYTPNEVVDFMIRGTDYLLREHFGRGLADEKVQILDPATGTGTFITNLINYLPEERLEYKYLNEIHANEVAILPYYIANLNIEYTYKERTGRYVGFPNLCFVDTLDNMGWQRQRGDETEKAKAKTTPRQSAFNLGGLSTENWLRVQEQNDKTISVIIGNPPYNANQVSWNDLNPNRKYPEIDRRIKESYIASSSARKTKQYDMYKRFMRWASDRLDDNGIITFITNRAYLETRQDDGFRQIVGKEFSDLYALDLGSDVRLNPKISGTTHNIFGIQTGVAIGFFVRDSSKSGRCNIHYIRRDDAELAIDKLAYLHDATLNRIPFDDILPNANSDWLNVSRSDFRNLTLLVGKEAAPNTTIFGLVSQGVSTNRDGWVYDFDAVNLQAKARLFAETYNKFLTAGENTSGVVIKWSRDLRNELKRGRRIVENDADYVQSLYRPFTVKHHFANRTMNDVLTKNHRIMFGQGLQRQNTIIGFCAKGKTFYVLAADKLVDLHFTGDTQCLPLYRYLANGKRIPNITHWGLRQFRKHYGDESISGEEIFAYTYAVLHDREYREKYAIDLLREFPRLPFYPDFRAWAEIGQELLDLHIGFESAEPFPLYRRDADAKPDKPRLRADKNRGLIILDGQTTLSGVPDVAWEYVLGSRSALEWVLDQYKEREPRDPTIAKHFNSYRFADYKEQVIDLLRRVCTVSVRTMELIDSMPSRSCPSAVKS